MLNHPDFESEISEVKKSSKHFISVYKEINPHKAGLFITGYLRAYFLLFESGALLVLSTVARLTILRLLADECWSFTVGCFSLKLRNESLLFKEVAYIDRFTLIPLFSSVLCVLRLTEAALSL